MRSVFVELCLGQPKSAIFPEVPGTCGEVAADALRREDHTLMYQAYAGDDELRKGYRLPFIVGVLSIIGALFFASLSTSSGAREIADIFLALALISVVFGIAAIAAGILVRCRSRSGVLLGIVVGALGVAFAAFDVVSALRVGEPITTTALPFVRIGLNLAIVRSLFVAEPYVRAEDR